ncbi:hypothetical protein C450_18909 [Halococcus salifodinae DSM 8989]|uniref:Uncharacterized protein n=1 Tax=Halococcus salifodinae DSM 8989 TaxID=1227456 RepID=M0MSX7_9EURY|nr:hypothetical protein C450_18909 [Halococcus salifodinae DSM 8989]
MTSIPVEALTRFVLYLLTMIAAGATLMWAYQSGHSNTDLDDLDSWWGRPSQRSDHEPSETHLDMLMFFAVLIGGFGLSALIMDFLF